MGFDLVRETRSKGRPLAGPLTVSYMDGRAPVLPGRLEPRQYRAYITSPQWRVRRAKYFTTHPAVCAGCADRQDIELHHKTYAHLGAERDEDLVPLCGSCHAAVHDIHRQRPHLSLLAATDLHLAQAQRQCSLVLRQSRKRPKPPTSEMQDAIRALNERQRRFVPARARLTSEQRAQEPLTGRAGRIGGLPVSTQP